MKQKMAHFIEGKTAKVGDSVKALCGHEYTLEVIFADFSELDRPLCFVCVERNHGARQGWIKLKTDFFLREGS